MMYYVGIDTSCYTTSVAILDQNRKLIYDGRVILNVGQGQNGLRQSEAVFQHITNLSDLIEAGFSEIDPLQIRCLSVSSRPRNIQDSYMPVFMAGVNMGKVIGSTLGIRVLNHSHQECHVLAGMWGADVAQGTETSFDSQFLVYHLSGGTTELLLINQEKDMDIQIIGGSQDLKAGQFIDRVGVALGLKFPCGQEMDKLCDHPGVEAIPVPISIDGCYTSFSGPESHIQRLIEKEQYPKDILSQTTFFAIAKSVEKTILAAALAYKQTQVLMVGGVASNNVLRQYLANSKKIKNSGINIIFTDKRYSPDNAVGAAIYAINHFEKAMEEK